MKTTLLLATAGMVLTSAAQALTALEALREIPDADRPMLAMIDGHEGTPEVDRWHFLFFDPTTESGVREFVVADGQVVADRQISQFADKLSAGSAVGALDVKVDSDSVSRTAQRFAAANGREIASMNFAMHRDELGGTPIWTVVCRDDQEHAFASLVIASQDGRIMSHEGFAIDPAKADAKRVAATTTASKTKRSLATQPRYAVRPDTYLPPIYDGPREYRDEDGTRIRRAEPVVREPVRPQNPIEGIHRFVRGLIPF